MMSSVVEFKDPYARVEIGEIIDGEYLYAIKYKGSVLKLSRNREKLVKEVEELNRKIEEGVC